MHLSELLACFALMFCILSYSFVVSTKNLETMACDEEEM